MLLTYSRFLTSSKSHPTFKIWYSLMSHRCQMLNVNSPSLKANLNVKVSNHLIAVQKRRGRSPLQSERLQLVFIETDTAIQRHHEIQTGERLRGNMNTKFHSFFLSTEILSSTDLVWINKPTIGIQYSWVKNFNKYCYFFEKQWSVAKRQTLF